MNIGIIDADLIHNGNHRFPNLACMKISAYEKEQSNNIKLITDYRNLFSKYNILDENKECIIVENMVFYYTIMIDKKKETRWYSSNDIIFDKIIISKVFTDTIIPERLLDLDIVQYGGTGFFYDKAPPLPDEIEHHMPDYHLYDDWINEQIEKGKSRKEFEYYLDYSIGFRTRKCFRKCSFCVNQNYDRVELASPIEEFFDETRKYICLLDDNFFGHPDWKSMLIDIQNYGRYFQFKQGLDERLLTKDKCEILSQSKYKGDYIFAFDNIEDKELISDKLTIWRQYCSKTTKFYVFCGFDRNDKYDAEFWKQDIIDTFERIKILMQFGCLPYIMRHENYEKSPYKGMYINLARWCNQPSFYKKKSFREFCLANGENSSTVRYMNEFEKDYPEIAKQYFDMKFEDLNMYK